MTDNYTGNKTTKYCNPAKAPQAPISEEGIQRAVQILESRGLCRYKESSSERDHSETSLLEQEFAAMVDKKYAAAFNSCGSSLFVALKCAGVQPGDSVLMNCFTLAPVPGAIAHAGANPILVNCGDDCRVDMMDLETKMRRLKDTSQQVKIFLLSHMRGLMPNLREIGKLCSRHGILLIQDCAHTMGATQKERDYGTIASCYSFQSNKHINAGEGGMLVTNDPDVAAQAILYSGSYMFYTQHIARPPESVFEKYKYKTPNFSLRMSELTAAIARSQLPLLPGRTNQWNRSYKRLELAFQKIPFVQVVDRNQDEQTISVGSSIQFRILVDTVPLEKIERWVRRCSQRGVKLQWFGRALPQGYTSKYQDWQYIPEAAEAHSGFLERLCDMRVPLDLTCEEAHNIATILVEEELLPTTSPIAKIPRCKSSRSPDSVFPTTLKRKYCPKT